MNRFMEHWEDCLSFVLGAVLLLSPSLFGFELERAAASNAHAVGAIMALMALSALFAFEAWKEWVNGALGVWLVISPLVLAFSEQGTAMLTHLLIGIVAIFLALVADSEHYSGHTIAGK